jgi:hypothetical protein
MQHVKAVQVDLDSKLATLQVEAANQNEALDMLPSFIAAIKVSKPVASVTHVVRQLMGFFCRCPDDGVL